MNVIWISANKFGYELLKEAVTLKKANISKIITLSDKAKTVMYDYIEKERWYDFGIDVIEIEDINEGEDLIKNLSPDLIILCGWRQVIKKEILSIPKNGVAGFHPTLLPVGRGPAPLINSILHGFTTSGVTIFYLSDGLDDGDIIGQEKFTIEDLDHAEDVYNKVVDAGKKLIKTYFPLLIEGNAPRKPQDHSKASIFQKPDLQNNEINFEEETIEEIYKKIRALSKPYKGAYIKKNGKKLVLWRAELLER